jgi:uncharacterized protein (DUF983 family)
MKQIQKEEIILAALPENGIDLKTDNKIFALLKMKCPKCHEGELFTTSNSYNIKRMHEMPPKCNECGQYFEPEPGFYTGAMYVNYGVFLFLISYLILEIILSVPPYVFFTTYIGILLLISPLMFRYSRVFFLYLMVSYDNEAIKKHKQQNNDKMDNKLFVPYNKTHTFYL